MEGHAPRIAQRGARVHACNGDSLTPKLKALALRPALARVQLGGGLLDLPGAASLPCRLLLLGLQEGGWGACVG